MESGRPVRGNSEFRRALESQPLRFAYEDGRVASVCPAEQEEKWVLNVKRGIISHLQNTMTDLQTDTYTKEVGTLNFIHCNLHIQIMSFSPQ